MPEGDTIFRIARQLQTVLVNHRIVAADSRASTIQAEPLVGRQVVSVEARGKHLLIHLDRDQSIHSHLGMTGSWHVYRLGQRWRKPTRNSRLALTVASATCVCFTPKTLELLSSNELRRHVQLSNLGPDLLVDPFDLKEAVRRIRSNGDRTIGDAVMDQRLVCGIGNVYKSEVLFLQQLDPFARAGTFSDDQLQSFLRNARRLMRRNLQSFRRQTRFGRDGPRLWVYGRSGDACLRCGVPIRMRRQGNLGRSTYWCPNCQGT